MAYRSTVPAAIIAYLTHTGASKKEGRTQAEISEHLGISRSTVSRVLSQDHRFDQSMLPYAQLSYWFNPGAIAPKRFIDTFVPEGSPPDYSNDLATGLEPALSASPAFIAATTRAGNNTATKEEIVAAVKANIDKVNEGADTQTLAAFLYRMAILADRIPVPNASNE